jgi:hypothetical protein
MFNSINNKLRSFGRVWEPDTSYPVLSPFVVRNKKVIGKSSLKTSPVPALPFMKILEKKFNFKFPDSLKPTHDEISERDHISFKNFSCMNFDMSKLNFTRLLLTMKMVEKLMFFDKIDLSLLSVDDSMKSFPNSTSSAYPYYTRKDDSETRLKTKGLVREYFNKNKNYKFLLINPCTVFHRFQFKNSSLRGLYFPDRLPKSNLDFHIDKKIRQVWALPYLIHTLEGMVLRNTLTSLINFQLNCSKPVFTSGLNLIDISKRIISPYRDLSRSSNCSIVSLDVESFDQNIPSFMWSFFNVSLKKLSENRLYRKVIDDLTFYWCYTPYIYTEKSKGLKSIPIYNQQKGIPSGSLITNLFGSYVSLFINVYALLEKTNDNITLDEIREVVTVLGDDNLILTKYISKDHIINVYKRFGLPVNPVKTFVCSYKSKVPFLGYIWDTENRPTQSYSWYITHFCLPSTFIDVRKFGFTVSDLNTYRCVSIFMSLYKGYQTFDYLIGDDDRIWKKFKDDYFNYGKDPNILITTGDSQIQYQRIPFSYIVNNDWENYQELLDSYRLIYKKVHLNFNDLIYDFDLDELLS